MSFQNSPFSLIKASSILSAIFVWIFIVIGCKDKPTEGCMDSQADNYCSFCNEANNCLCEFNGDAVFFYQFNVADSMTNAGSTSLSYYVDGTLAGSIAIYRHYWPSDPIFLTSTGPECEEQSVLTVNKKWNCDHTHSYNYIVKDQRGIEYFHGSIQYTVGECQKVELKF